MKLTESLLARISILFGFLFFAGFVHLVTYYNEFGFRFSDLSLEYYHVFYRGMILVSSDWPATLLFFLLLAALLADLHQLRIAALGKLGTSGLLPELAVFVAFLAIWPVARWDGFEAGQRDSAASSTQLRELVALNDRDGKALPVFVRLGGGSAAGPPRAVHVVRKTASQIFVIVPPEDVAPGAVHPAVTAITLRAGDHYVEKVSRNLDR